MSIRATLNAGDPNRVPSGLQAVKFGSILNFLLNAATPNQGSTAVSSSKGTLTAQPDALLDVKVLTVGSGSATGRKTILKGQITGPNAIVPAAGQVVWDGNVTLLFASADAAATFSALFTTAADATVGALARELGQQDTP